MTDPTNIFGYPKAGGRNPDAWSRRDEFGNVLVDPNTAYKSRLKAGRIFAPASAALSAQNALFNPTLALAERGVTDYGNLFRRASDASRAHQVTQAETSDPAGFNLLNLLTGDASDLVDGESPLEDHDLQQALRAAQQARGTGYGTRDVLTEALGLDRARETRRMSRGAYAGGILGLRQNFFGSPVAQPEGASVMSPISPTPTGDLFSTSLNDTLQRRNQQAANQAGQRSLWGAGISALGSVAGGAARIWAGGGKGGG